LCSGQAMIKRFLQATTPRHCCKRISEQWGVSYKQAVTYKGAGLKLPIFLNCWLLNKTAVALG
jgi:hypothetical protein